MDPNDQNNDLDTDDNIFGEEASNDDGFDDELRANIEKLIGDDGEEDTGGLDAPLEDTELPETVGPEEGADLASEARMKAKEGTKAPDAKTDPRADATDPGEKTDDNADDPEAKGREKTSGDDLSTAPFADLLKDVPDTQRAELTRRMTEAESVLAPFQTEAAKAELQRHGATPQDAIGRLVELNAFAQQKPDEYLAWVAREMKGDDAHEALEGAAKHFGYKLVKDGGDEDDDLFLDDDMRAIKEENDRLKRQLNGDAPTFGPDTPQRQQERDAQRALQTFTSEMDPTTGTLKRPYFNQLQERIATLAKDHVQKSQAPVTVEDLDRFYNAAVAEAQTIAGGAGGSAAQEKPAVPSKDKQAAAEKALKASKSVDGTGQGAGRRPALPDDAPLEDVIRAQLAKYN